MTFTLATGAPRVVSVEDAGLTDGSAGACTNACTKSTESGHDGTLEALAATLLKLSPDERDRLAAMLAGQESSEGQSAH